MTNKVVVFGTGQFADMAEYYLRTDSEYEVAAFALDSDYISEATYAGKPVVPFEELPVSHPPDLYKQFIPISYTGVNKAREAHYNQAKQTGYELISYVSSNAQVADNVRVGDNCFIFELNNIQPYVSVGNNCILWSGNHIGHHTTIGDHVFIASHAVISGSVKIGDNTFIGVNATLRDNIIIGMANVIGAGTCILNDTNDWEVYAAKRSKPASVKSHELKGI